MLLLGQRLVETGLMSQNKTTFFNGGEVPPFIEVLQQETLRHDRWMRRDPAHYSLYITPAKKLVVVVKGR